MRFGTDSARRLAAAGMLLALAACTTAPIERPEAPGVNPNEAGNTNDPAAGFQNVQPGSEEDFILNVGRRTFFTAGSASLDSVARATLDQQADWLSRNPRWLLKLQGFADDPGSDSAQVALSKKRAEAVMAYLAAKGVDPTACGRRAMARTGRCAPAPRHRAACRTGGSFQICATNATRRRLAGFVSLKHVAFN